MPTKLLPHLRLLQPSSFSPAMKLVNPSLQYSRSIPIFCRIFPFKLKYHALLTPQAANHLGLRTLSTQPFRRRTVTTRRLEPSTRASSGPSSSSKSLIEDEAELSDWVSELRTDTFRGRLTSDEEDDDRGRGGKVRKRGENKENNRIRERDSYSFSRKRNRESDRDEDGFGGRVRRSSGFDTNLRRSAISRGRFDGEMYEGEGNYPTRKFGKGKTSSFMGRREGREFDLRGGRGSRGNGHSLRRNAGVMGRYEEDEDGDDEEIERMKGIGSLGDLISEESSEDAEDESDDGDRFLKKSENALFGSERGGITQKAERVSGGKSDSYLSETRFDQCSISPLSLKGITDAGYEKMTVVQEATLPVILKGKDVLAKAKTGTGKTVAFLLPSIEVILNSPAAGRNEKRPPIHVLVICPTRELAIQAAGEANTLLKYHPSIGVQVVIGGTRLALEQKRMQANPCQILVATPGRLRDHMENTAGFATRLMGLKVLVLDEADHLLDMGFRKDIEKILAAVPKQRQTLLFSATVPEDVRQICHVALKRDHEFINTVQEGSEETHSQVTQMHLVAPLEKHFSLLYVLLKEHIADDVDYKILVFCTTAMVTKLVADLLGELNLNVREIHSRKSQSYRIRVSDEFRKSKGLILVTSDVSARGVDYPDVTLVIQVGLPADREQYIHRLGRTGRKGKEGQGILLLAPWEEFFLSSIKGLPITKAPVPSVDPETAKKVQRALSHVEVKSKAAAYQAWLGYYNSDKKIGKDKYRLVELANEFSRTMGLDNPPALPKIVIGKMGLKNVPGLRLK